MTTTDDSSGQDEGGTALVVGAQGVIGRGLVEELAGRGTWDVIGLSRRGGTSEGRVRHVSVDLLDAAGARAALAAAGGVERTTHLFYAAYRDAPTWAGLVAPNLTMLRTALDAVEGLAPGLRHVSLMQGYKVYGAHLGPFKTPAREDDPPHLPPEFNVEQQALVEARAAAGGWAWSAIRPSVVAGVGVGNPMNLAMLLAVYGSVIRELGVPMRFPGKPGAYDALLELTDAGLLARATVWAATDPRAAGEAFNVANGDLFRWSELWPKLAAWFELDAATPLAMPLTDVMADKGPLWAAMTERHGLQPIPYEQLAAWPFGDFVLGWDYDLFGDGSKLRRHGFHEYVQTDAMLLGILDRLRADRIIP